MKILKNVKYKVGFSTTMSLEPVPNYSLLLEIILNISKVKNTTSLVEKG
jgi:hypothetical protein